MKLLNKIKIHPLFLGIIIIGLITGYFKYLIYIFLIIIIHEMGHLVISIIFKRSITSVTILPFGGLVKMDSDISSDIFEDLLISIGGIFAQVILGITLSILYKNDLINLDVFEFMSSYNKLIMIFNMLPITPLDGYKILKYMTELFIPFKKTFYISLEISLIVLLSCLIFNIDLILDNIFIFVFLIISLFTEVKNIKFIMGRFYLERIIKTFSYKIKDVHKKENMFKNRVNYINGIHERDYLNTYLHEKTSKHFIF